MSINIVKITNWEILSWKKTINNLLLLQRRIFKSVLVKDIKKCFYFQRLLVSSKSARLVSIRFVFNSMSSLKDSLSPKYTLSNKIFLTNKITLLKRLEKNFYTWDPCISGFSLVSTGRKTKKITFFTIEDRCWQNVLKLALEPAHEANFEPQILGFRKNINLHFVQKVVLLNLSKKAFGFQKRILVLQCIENANLTHFESLLNKIFVSRKVKLIIFRFLSLGLNIDFNEVNLQFNSISSLLANIFLTGFKPNCSWIRFGAEFVFFLRPFDCESHILSRLEIFMNALGFKKFLQSVFIVSLFEGFDFLGWNFKCSYLGNLICTPSVSSYQNFLLRVKSIINNSNYGAVCFLS